MVLAMLNGDPDWIARLTLERRPLSCEAVGAARNRVFASNPGLAKPGFLFDLGAWRLS